MRLGLVLTETDYEKLSITHHEAAWLLEDHNEKLYIFHEVLKIENILKSQTLHAIEPIYFSPLINKNINKIDKTISERFKHKFGQIDFTQVELLERRGISNPPDIFYNIIEELITFAEDVNLTKTNNQLLSHGLKIIRSTGDFV